MERPAASLYGRSLRGELAAAMERVGSYGVTYPEGYRDQLAMKYSGTGVRYPHILMILGKPRISHHFFYRTALRRAGKFLDYSCGTGDNVRQLIRDGFSYDRITAFDINRESIDLGFDLYRDRDALEDLIVVSDTFPFGPGEFDMIYSASVFHVITDEKEFLAYLSNAHFALAHGGIFFGSTLGLAEGIPERSSGTRGPPRIMAQEDLAGYLAAAGFAEHEIIRRPGVPRYVPKSEELCIFEFCTGTSASS